MKCSTPLARTPRVQTHETRLVIQWLRSIGHTWDFILFYFFHSSIVFYFFIGDTEGLKWTFSLKDHFTTRD